MKKTLKRRSCLALTEIFSICDQCDRRVGVDSGGVGSMWCVCSHMYSQEYGSNIIHKLLSALKVNMGYRPSWAVRVCSCRLETEDERLLHPSAI